MSGSGPQPGSDLAQPKTLPAALRAKAGATQLRTARTVRRRNPMTRDTKIARAVRHALWTSAVAAAATIPAYAQDQDQQPAEAQTVVVTGSRIVRQDYSSNSPITSVSDSAIK